MPTVNSNTTLADLSRRDEQIIDALHMARYILAGPEVIVDPALRLARAKAAVDEACVAVESALKLMQPRRS